MGYYQEAYDAECAAIARALAVAAERVASSAGFVSSRTSRLRWRG